MWFIEQCQYWWWQHSHGESVSFNERMRCVTLVSDVIGWQWWKMVRFIVFELCKGVWVFRGVLVRTVPFDWRGYDGVFCLVSGVFVTYLECDVMGWYIGGGCVCVSVCLCVQPLRNGSRFEEGQSTLATQMTSRRSWLFSFLSPFGGAWPNLVANRRRKQCVCVHLF